MFYELTDQEYKNLVDLCIDKEMPSFELDKIKTCVNELYTSKYKHRPQKYKDKILYLQIFTTTICFVLEGFEKGVTINNSLATLYQRIKKEKVTQ